MFLPIKNMKMEICLIQQILSGELREGLEGTNKHND